MINNLQEDINQRAYRNLKPEIDRTYPKGHFVAIDEGKIVADAPTFQELDARLDAMGKPSPEILVVQSGDELSGFGWIFSGEESS